MHTIKALPMSFLIPNIWMCNIIVSGAICAFFGDIIQVTHTAEWGTYTFICCLLFATIESIPMCLKIKEWKNDLRDRGRTFSDRCRKTVLRKSITETE